MENTIGENIIMSAEAPRYSIQPKQDSRLSVVSETEQLQIQTLQAQWDSALGRKQNAPGQFENYNPVLARWGFDRLQSPEQTQLFRVNEIQNVTTALRERNHTTESRLRLTIGPDKKIHNEVFPDSSYEEVLERGVRYRAENGSQETEREEAEIRGFLKIQEVLTSEDTKIGTSFIVISPPGLNKETPYVHNFVDSYELAEDEYGRRSIQYTRFASPLGYDQYSEIAQGFDSKYFEEQTEPIDAWYLENPILVSVDNGFGNIDEVLEKHFAKDVNAMEEEQFQELYKTYLPYILYYLDQITKTDFDSVEVAKAYNAILLSTENDEMKKETTVFLANNEDVSSIVDRFGRFEVEKKQAGCGSSSGFTIGSSGFFTANSVSFFGGGRGSKEWFNCPKCKYKADGPIGNTCPGCRLTKEEYVEGGGQEC